MVEALLDRLLRAKDAPRTLEKAFLDKIIVVCDDKTQYAAKRASEA